MHSYKSFYDPAARPLFGAAPAAGRRITAGFTYLQRIGKAASYDVWFPDALTRLIAARGTARPDDFPAHWAAVRQFELLQESGNHKIYDLDPQNLQRATLDLARSMRAGGLRVTVATLGSYRDDGGDDLEILDRDLQTRIGRLIHMLYMDQASAEADTRADGRLAAGSWNFLEQLPHVGMVLGAGDLFHAAAADEAPDPPRRRKRGDGETKSPALLRRRARKFFEILNLLPQNHIVHDTAFGLQLPELNGENHWNYIAASDETLDSFNRVLNALFDKFNHVSLARLQGDRNAGAEIKSSTLHLRGYGHPLAGPALDFYRSAALALH